MDSMYFILFEIVTGVLSIENHPCSKTKSLSLCLVAFIPLDPISNAALLYCLKIQMTKNDTEDTSNAVLRIRVAGRVLLWRETTSYPT
jgi:hypothetical protein